MKDRSEFYQGKTPRVPALTGNEEWTAVLVAKYWDLKPWEYRHLLPERQAELRAAYDVQKIIDYYNSSEQERIFDNMNKTKP